MPHNVKYTDTKTISVTGSTGDIGSQLCTFLLNRGCRVSVLCRPESRYKLSHKIPNHSGLSRVYWGSLFDIEVLKNMIVNSSSVIHMAALLDTETHTTDEKIAVNGFLTGIVSNLIKELNPAIRVFYLSSAMVYPLIYNDLVHEWIYRAFTSFNAVYKRLIESRNIEYELLSFTNDFLKANPLPAEKTGAYAVGKYLGEYFVSKMNNFVIGRLSNTYGPGYVNDRLIPRLIRGRIRGATITIKNKLRDYVYVDDLNRAIYVLIDPLNSRSKYIADLCSGSIVSVGDICSMIENMTPTTYGKFLITENGNPEVPAYKKYIPGELKFILDGTPFYEGLSDTIKFIKSFPDPEMLYTEDIAGSLEVGVDLVKPLPGSSAANVLLLRSRKTGKRFVRKYGLRGGFEGNGAPKVSSEIAFYRELANNQNYGALKSLYPRLLSAKNLGRSVYFDMEYLGEGTNVSEALASGVISVADLFQLLADLLNHLISQEYINSIKILSKARSLENLKKYYFDRSLTRVAALNYCEKISLDFKATNKEEVLKTLSGREFVINGKTVINPRLLLHEFLSCRKLRDRVRPRIENLCTHGDLTLLNTVYDQNNKKIYLIDPRGFIGMWDPLYDLGKMKFSLSGFSDVVLGNICLEHFGGSDFHLDFTNKKYKYRESLIKASEKFIPFLEKHDTFTQIQSYEPYWKERILFIEAVNYIADVPFRLFTEDSLKGGITCYLLGTALLNDLYKSLI